MAIVTPSVIRDAIPAQGLKIIEVELAATVDTGDTFDLTLADYGATTFLGAQGFIHSTTDSIVIVEQPTTSVTTGVLTVTVGGSGANNQKRMYIIYCR